MTEDKTMPERIWVGFPTEHRDEVRFDASDHAFPSGTEYIRADRTPEPCGHEVGVSCEMAEVLAEALRDIQAITKSAICETLARTALSQYEASRDKSNG